MSTRITVATRKGIFDLARGDAGWTIGDPASAGDRCILTATDPRTGTRWASFDLGHFGPKLKRSDDGGATWTEVKCPVYPEQPEDWSPTQRPLEGEPAAWRLRMVFALAFGSTTGNLFISEDSGDSWTCIHANLPPIYGVEITDG